MSKDKLSVEALTDVTILRNFVTHGNAELRSYPTAIYRTWSNYFPPERFKYFFLEDVITHAEQTRASILRFLGANPDKTSENLPASYDSKAARKRVSMTDEAKAFLVSHFEAELRCCAELFGGPAVGWPAKYGLA